MGRHRVICEFPGGITKAEIAPSTQDIVATQRSMEDEVGKMATCVHYVDLDAPTDETPSFWSQVFGGK